jgi:hypothetical protein
MQLKLNRQTILGACVFASTDKAYRDGILCGVHITPTHIMATDSYVAVSVRHASEADAVSFEPLTLDAVALKKAATRFKKNSEMLIQTREGKPTDVAQMTDFALNIAGERIPVPLLDGQYPDVLRLVDSPNGAYDGAVGLNPYLTERVAKGIALAAAPPELMRVTVGSPLKPVRYTFETADGEGIAVQMPVRLG